MDISVIDREIKKIVKNEDAAQDVWVKILEENIEDIKEIKKLASRRRVGGREYVLRDNPSQDRYDKSDRSLFDRYILGTPYKTTIHPRSTDVRCKYCGTSQVYLYGFYKFERLYWCRLCQRKFKDNNHSFHQKHPPEHKELATSLHVARKTLRQIRESLSNQYGHKYSIQTIWCWLGGVRRQPNANRTAGGFYSILVVCPLLVINI